MTRILTPRGHRVGIVSAETVPLQLGEQDRTLITRLAQLVFVLAVCLRLGLSLVNSEANDNHVEVIKIIVDENRIPTKGDVWEGFQPKLFHVTAAVLAKILSRSTESELTQVGQFVACTAGILTLVVVWRFLFTQTLSDRIRLAAFAMVALNPKLIGMSAQATNDSMVILFVSLALYHGYAFFRQWDARHFAWMTLSTILAGITKGNGLVVAVAICFTFVCAAMLEPRMSVATRAKRLLWLTVFASVVLLTVPRLGPYWEHYQHYGSPFVINNERAAPPQLFTLTFENRPGVVSIVHSYFTFRLIDLLQEPMLTYSHWEFPKHRTSLWSQLYARAHFVHFDAWPPSWELREEFVQNLGRAILILALFPTTLFLIGLAAISKSILRAIVRRADESSRVVSEVLLVSTFVGYLAFIVSYTYAYRDFATMKVIFIFPATLAYVASFVRGLRVFDNGLRRWPAASTAASALLIALSTLYVIDVGILIYQLA